MTNARRLLPRRPPCLRACSLLGALLFLAAAPPALSQAPVSENAPGEPATEKRAPEAPEERAAEGEGPEGEATDRPSRWFSRAASFAPLLAAPRETGIRGAILLAQRHQPDGGEEAGAGGSPFVGGDFEGTNFEAEVVLGHRIPLLILMDGSDGGPLVTLELDVGIFSRFFLETPQNDLINTDYRVGFPVGAAWNGWEGRLDLRHISSHAGDDFARRFGISDRQVSLDGFELLLARRLGDGFRVYGGGEWNFRATAFVETWAGRAGLEFDPGRDHRDRSFWPFAAVDLRANDVRERLEGTGTAGVALRVRSLTLRLEGRGYLGPSPMGWLRTSDESYWGLGLRVEP